MYLEESTTVGSYEFNQPNTFAPIDPAKGGLLPHFPTAEPVLTPVRVGMPERPNGARENHLVIYRRSDPRSFSERTKSNHTAV